MALSIDHLFFDIQHKRACWLKHAQELLGARQKPFDIAIRMNASVSTLPAICIWGRSDHQINAAGWLRLSYVQTISLFDQRFNRHGIPQTNFLNSLPRSSHRALNRQGERLRDRKSVV